MHWNRLDDIQKTFWSGISNNEVFDKLQEKGVLQQVEKAFAAKEVSVKKKAANPSLPNMKVSKVSLLPRDLAQQFGINMHMFSNLSVEELFAKILSCDESILENISVLEFFNSDGLNEIPDSVLRNFKPYSIDYSDPSSEPQKQPDELERPDRIYLEIFNMRTYWKSRSRALLIMRTYKKDYRDLLEKLELLDQASNSIQSSESLKQILGIIRSVGNFMNDYSKQAMGFKLDTLQRLKFIKDESNTMTFLHYVEKIVRNNFPEYGSFVDELAVLNHLHNINIEQIEADCEEFDRSIANVLNSIVRGNLSNTEEFHPDDKILTVIQEPLEAAKLKGSMLKSHLKRTVDTHNALMEHFGEHTGDSASRNSFFQKFATFVNEFKKVHVENVQREEEERAYELKKQAIERRERAKREKRALGAHKRRSLHSKHARSKLTASQTDPKPALSEGEGKEENLEDEAIHKNAENDAEEEEDDELDEEDEEDDDEDDDDDDEEDDEDEDEDGDVYEGSEDVSGDLETMPIDELMRQLKLVSSVRDSNRRRRVEELSRQTYSSSVSTDNLLDTASEAEPGLAKPVSKDYQNVDLLRRRMTTRKKTNLGRDESPNRIEKVDEIMLRAQSMLQELRSDYTPEGREGPNGKIIE